MIDGKSADEQQAVLDRLAEIGATWVIVSAWARTVAKSLRD
jgi:hypothetical protein